MQRVAQSDVDDALRLIQMSKYSLYSDDRQRAGLDAISDIYSVLRDEAARTNRLDIRYAHALNLISRKVNHMNMQQLFMSIVLVSVLLYSLSPFLNFKWSI